MQLLDFWADQFWPVKTAKSMAQLIICSPAFWSSQVFSIINNITLTICYDMWQFSSFEFCLRMNPLGKDYGTKE